MTFSQYNRGCHGRDRMVFGLIITQSVPITTNVVSLNSAHGEVYSIQHYMIKFVSDLRQVGGFFRILQLPPLILIERIVMI